MKLRQINLTVRFGRCRRKKHTSAVQNCLHFSGIKFKLASVNTSSYQIKHELTQT